MKRYWFVYVLCFIMLASTISYALEIKQSTARNIRIFMTDGSDHLTGKTSLELSIKTAPSDTNVLSLISPVVTEIGYGWYDVALTSAYTSTLGDMAAHIEAAGADPTDFKIDVVANLEADTYALASNITTTTNAIRAKTEAYLDASVSSRSTLTGVVQTGDSYPLITAMTATVGTNLNATISSRSTLTAGDVWNTDVNSYTSPSAGYRLLNAASNSGLAYLKALDIYSEVTNTFTGNDAIKTAISSLPTASQNASAAWNATAGDYIALGSMGQILNDTYYFANAGYSNVSDPNFGNAAIKTAISLIAGSGNTVVNENTGGTDNLRYTYQSSGIGNGNIVAYLTSDYAAGNTSSVYIKGSTTTKDDGRWQSNLMLNSGVSYTLIYYKPGVFQATTKEVTP